MTIIKKTQCNTKAYCFVNDNVGYFIYDDDNNDDLDVVFDVNFVMMF